MKFINPPEARDRRVQVMCNELSRYLHERRAGRTETGEGRHPIRPKRHGRDQLRETVEQVRRGFSMIVRPNHIFVHLERIFLDCFLVGRPEGFPGAGALGFGRPWAHRPGAASSVLAPSNPLTL